MKETIYHVAMYLRLSRDDTDANMRDTNIPDTNVQDRKGSVSNIKSESNSISSQRAIIRSFIREHGDMELYDIYVDDGFTGSNFDRPDFKRMIKDIEAGEVNCVIVKDLSRFGRDYIEAGRYIQKSFPKQGVRFIAITDHFDSQTADHSESSIVLPVKNFINDSYCRDISAKVRSGQKIKRENGEFVGPFAVYGYRKDKNNRNKFIPDEYAAHVVKNIFVWKIEGISASAIADRLNDLGILSPMEYKRSLGENFRSGFVTGTKSLWHPHAVIRILTNEIYIGHMIQGKKEKINYKVKKEITKPESEWVKVKNTHEPIIDEDDFNIVQNLLKSDGRATSGGKDGNFFSGLLFCGHCREQLVRRMTSNRGQEKVTFICSTYNRGEGCERHKIAEAELKEVVFRECCVYANSFLKQDDLLQEISRIETNFDVITQYDKEVERLRAEQDKYYRLTTGLYEDLRNGILTKAEFEKLHKTYSESSERLGKSLNSQELLIKKLFRQGIAAGTRLEKFKNCLELDEIDRTTLANLVHRIDFYGHNRMEITFNFQDEFTTASFMNQCCKMTEGRAQYV